MKIEKKMKSREYYSQEVNNLAGNFQYRDLIKI